MLHLLKDKTLEVLKAVLPLIVVVVVLEVTLVKASAALLVQFLVSAVMVVAGMVLFLLGIHIGVLPMGELVGAELPRRRSLWLIVAVAFLIGFATTIAEPDLLVLSRQVDSLSQGAISETVLTYVIGIGVAFFVGMAMLRVVYGFPMAYLLTASYLVVLVLSFLTPPGFVSVAFDSGSVTTGALSAPIIIALGIGFSAVLAGRSAMADGFGLVGLASLGPIIAVMIMGIVAG